MAIASISLLPAFMLQNPLTWPDRLRQARCARCCHGLPVLQQCQSALLLLTTSAAALRRASSSDDSVASAPRKTPCLATVPLKGLFESQAVVASDALSSLSSSDPRIVTAMFASKFAQQPVVSLGSDAVSTGRTMA